MSGLPKLGVKKLPLQLFTIIILGANFPCGDETEQLWLILMGIFC